MTYEVEGVRPRFRTGNTQRAAHTHMVEVSAMISYT